MELREITELANGEDGFQDIGLLITDTKKEDDRLIFTGLGLFKGDTVGLGFKTNTRFDPGLIPGGGMNPEKGFSKDAVQVFSLGKQSNNFVKALSTLYGLPTNKEFANKPLIASAFSLNDQEVDLGKPNGYNKFKLFFQRTLTRFTVNCFLI